MAVAKIHIEAPQLDLSGVAEIGINEISCVCGKCNNRDLENASIEFNFKEMKVYYLCSRCKHMNEMFFGPKTITPLPKTRFGR
jgi:hypothetical protein